MLAKCPRDAHKIFNRRRDNKTQATVCNTAWMGKGEGGGGGHRDLGAKAFVANFCQPKSVVMRVFCVALLIICCACCNNL